MVHNLNIENGEASMMSVRETPWHGLGAVLDKPPTTIGEALTAAKLDWQVGLKPVYCMDGGVYLEITDKKAIVRLDKWGQEDCAIFGLVGNDYQVLQNHGAFAFFDTLVQTRKVTFETAGALGRGERVWVLAKVADDMKIGNTDTVEKYLLFSTGHDGRTSVQIRFTPVRVVCQNTLIASLSSGNDLFKIYHVPGMRKAIELAEDAVNRIFGEYESLEKVYQQLASRQLKSDDLNDYLSAVFPDPKPKRGQSETSYRAALLRVQETRKLAANLSKSGKGNNREPVRGTLWAAYNGIVEMIDHHTNYATAWKRLESTCFGEGERTKQLAFKEAKKMLATPA